MNINIITAGQWILKFISQRIIEHNVSKDVEIRMLHSPPMSKGDVNLFVDMGVCTGVGLSNNTNIGLFTHLHANDVQEHFKYHDVGRLKKMDGVIFMCDKYKKTIIDQKIYEGPSIVARPGVYLDRFNINTKLGIFQRGNAIGKGRQFLIDLCEQFDLSSFEFIFVAEML